jgi:hypothetical protein
MKLRKHFLKLGLKNRQIEIGEIRILLGGQIPK